MFNSNCASVPLVANIDGYGSGNGFNDGGWSWWIIILLIFGWGGNGFGFGGYGGGYNSPGLQGLATRADINEGFALNNLQSGITAIQQGICDSTYALNNTITNGFHGVDNAICNVGYNMQAGFNALGHQLSDCCCSTQRQIEKGFADTNYNMATQACETRQAIADSTRSILDFLTQDKISSLTAENQSLKFAASQAQQNAFITANQEAQTAELIRRLGADCPQPAYVVQPPQPVTFPINSCGTFSGYSNGCGCA